MFLHNFKYFFKINLRDKESILWILLFPIVLGTFFKVAFGGFAQSEEFATIPVAIVADDSETSEEFTRILDELAKEENGGLLQNNYVSQEEALSLLEEKKVDGIIYAEDKLSLTVSAQMSNSKLNQSILGSVVEQVNMKFDLITNIMNTHPEKLMDVMDSFEKETQYVTEKSFTDGNIDVSVQYFTNLIAMTCLYTSMTGIMIVIRNQANLSDIGARKNVSPVHKLSSIAAELFANIIFQIVCVMISIMYLIYILKIDFGVSLPMMILTESVGCLVGVTSGFFVGSIGKAGAKVKVGVLMAINMLFCFLSGLMVANMRMIVEQFCPFINKINPAALISDSFYALNIYDTYERYTGNMITMVGFSIFFCVGGLLLVRRQKYASL